MAILSLDFEGKDYDELFGAFAYVTQDGNIVLPPGNSQLFSFATGYEDTGIRPPLPIQTNPITGEAVSVNQTYVNNRRDFSPIDLNPIIEEGHSVHDVVVRDGFKIQAGDFNLRSTGKVYPRFSTGWSSSNAANKTDGICASDIVTGSSTNNLVCSGFEFDLPEDAQITGIEVTVRRSYIGPT